MLTAVESLIAHGNFAWVDEVAARLPGMKDRMDQINAAGFLAEGGRYEGWPTVRSAIVEKRVAQQANGYPQKALFTEALIQVPRFAGMKDATGQPVNLSVELDRMLTEAPAENKKAIMDAMMQFAPPVHTEPRNKSR